MSILKPEASVMASLGAAGLVYSIFQASAPSIVDQRVSPPDDPELSAAERQATWMAAAIVSGVALISRDPLIFTVGAGTIVALAWSHRLANAYDAVTGGVPTRTTQAEAAFSTPA